jgi:hypothetical protein
MIRSGEGQNIVPDRIIFVPLHGEPFFPRFYVVRQSAIGKTEPPWLIADVDDSAGIQELHATESPQDTDDLAWFDGRVRPKWFNPAEAKLLPSAKSLLGGDEGSLASADFDVGVVHDVAKRRFLCARPNCCISEGELGLPFKKSTNE